MVKLVAPLQVFAYQMLTLHLLVIELLVIQINTIQLDLYVYNTNLSCYQTPNDKVGRTSSGVLPTKR